MSHSAARGPTIRGRIYIIRHEKSRQAGASTLEMLISLAILLPLLISFSFTIHRENKFNVQLKASFDEFQSMVLIHKLSQQVMDDLDTHRFHITPRIHYSSEISFTDGTINNVSTNQAFAPEQQSQALTGLRLNPMKTLEIKTCQVLASRAFLRACEKQNFPYPMPRNKGFIGVSAEGLREWQGAVQGRGHCRTLILSQTRSMSVPSESLPDPCTTHLVIPILEHYTIYLDRSGSLRYVSHAGTKNIENQPLGARFKKISFAGEYNVDSALWRLESNITLLSGKQKTASYLHHLARHGHLQFLLQP